MPCGGCARRREKLKAWAELAKQRAEGVLRQLQTRAEAPNRAQAGRSEGRQYPGSTPGKKSR